jgi:hypothetical protein
MRRGVDQDQSVCDKFGAQPVQGVDHPGVRFHDAALKLGDVVVGQLSEQFGCACGESPRLQVDKVKLLFGT